jgi:hypothetical protein
MKLVRPVSRSTATTAAREKLQRESKRRDLRAAGGFISFRARRPLITPRNNSRRAQKEFANAKTPRTPGETAARARQVFQYVKMLLA